MKPLHNNGNNNINVPTIRKNNNNNMSIFFLNDTEIMYPSNLSQMLSNETIIIIVEIDLQKTAHAEHSFLST